MDDKKWDEIRSKWASRTPEFKTPLTLKEKDFNKDLKRGHEGEHSFFMRFQSCLTHLDGRNADFEINKTAETIELKTDYYDHDQTPNFFMEKYSYLDTPGGPWQALSKKIDYFIYFYPSNGALYIFNTAQLIKKLKKLEPILKLVTVKNKGYSTRGYKVSRQLLEDIMLDEETIGLHEGKK
jgi:hypothetical protein